MANDVWVKITPLLRAVVLDKQKGTCATESRKWSSFSSIKSFSFFSSFWCLESAVIHHSTGTLNPLALFEDTLCYPHWTPASGDIDLELHPVDLNCPFIQIWLKLSWEGIGVWNQSWFQIRTKVCRLDCIGQSQTHLDIFRYF